MGVITHHRHTNPVYDAHKDGVHIIHGKYFSKNLALIPYSCYLLILALSPEPLNHCSVRTLEGRGGREPLLHTNFLSRESIKWRPIFRSLQEAKDELGTRQLRPTE